MKCPKEIRVCPNGWTDCSLCVNEKLCIAGLYKPEETTDLEVVIKAAEISERVVQAEVREIVEKIRETWAEKFSKMTEEERWAEYGKYQTPNLQSVEPWQAMAGPSAPGGGGTCKVPKKPKKKMPEYLKTFGQ